MNKLLVLITLLLTTPAVANTVTLTWTNATQSIDGTLIPTDTTDPASLASTTIYWSACNPDNTVTITPGLEKTVPTTVPGQAETTTVEIGTPGNWCFIGIHTNLAGNSSDFSGVAIKQVIIPPQPPVNFTVDPGDLFAYAISQSADRIVLIPVGTIVAGTQCNPTMYVNGKYLVPRSSVSWAGTSRFSVVFASCL